MPTVQKGAATMIDVSASVNYCGKNIWKEIGQL